MGDNPQSGRIERGNSPTVGCGPTTFPRRQKLTVINPNLRSRGRDAPRTGSQDACPTLNGDWPVPKAPSHGLESR